MKHKIINWTRNASSKKLLMISLTLAAISFFLGISSSFAGRNILFVSSVLTLGIFNLATCTIRDIYGSREIDEVEFECQSIVEYFEKEVSKLEGKFVENTPVN